MSSKVACVIPPRWSMAEYDLHTCDDRSHFHFSQSEFSQHLCDGSVELLRRPDSRRGVKAVVRIVRVVRRGISCSVGEGLALMLLADETRSLARVIMHSTSTPYRPEATYIAREGSGGSNSPKCDPCGPRSTTRDTPAK